MSSNYALDVAMRIKELLQGQLYGDHRKIKATIIDWDTCEEIKAYLGSDADSVVFNATQLGWIEREEYE